MEIIREIEQALKRTDLEQKFRPGDKVRVHLRIKEGGKERVQQFEGTVMSRKGNGALETFTVRKVSYGVGVERIFPVHSPLIEKIDIVSTGQVRRGKLYYLRALRGKAARIKEKYYGGEKAEE